MVAEVTEASFDQEVLKDKLPVLVDFWAPWCGPCRMVGPVVEAISKDFAGRVKVVKCNTDDNPDIAARYHITGIPNLIVFKDGQVADQIVGFVPQNVLAEKLNATLKG